MRWQADTVVVARTRTVGTMSSALDQLGAGEVAGLGAEGRTRQIFDRLVVLCGDRAAHPVVNLGQGRADRG